MGTSQAMFAIQVGKIGGGMLGCEVGLKLAVVCRQGAADDLFDGAGMQVNAWSKFGHFGHGLQPGSLALIFCVVGRVAILLDRISIYGKKLLSKARRLIGHATFVLGRATFCTNLRCDFL